MTDIVDRATRSRMMKSVRRERTAPEDEVAQLLRDLHVSYRRNARYLPGTPDFANARRGWAAFVHGCFWHAHAECPKTRGGRDGRVPSANREFWATKLAANRARDAAKRAALEAKGLRVEVIWECELRDRPRLKRRLRAFLLGGD